MQDMKLDISPNFMFNRINGALGTVDHCTCDYYWQYSSYGRYVMERVQEHSLTRPIIVLGDLCTFDMDERERS